MGDEDTLTKRQTEMMNLVKLGHANKQIAKELGLLWVP